VQEYTYNEIQDKETVWAYCCEVHLSKRFKVTVFLRSHLVLELSVNDGDDDDNNNNNNNNSNNNTFYKYFMT
jgi:hypothetical protein